MNSNEAQSRKPFDKWNGLALHSQFVYNDNSSKKLCTVTYDVTISATGGNIMLTIRCVEPEDKSFWFTLDKHISEKEFFRKVRDKTGYVLLQDTEPIGLLRYNLFWDNTPFCNLLYIAPAHQKKGLGKKLMLYWEDEMRALGYEWIMTSTQADEDAQHFYRKMGYQDAGALIINIPPAAQPAELFFIKAIETRQS